MKYFAQLVAVVALSGGCGSERVKEGSGPGGDTAGTDGTDGGTGASASASGGEGVCAGHDCGGHGQCVVVAELPRCVCDVGYTEDPRVPTCEASAGGSASGGTTTATGATTGASAGTASASGGTTTGGNTSTGGGADLGEPCDSASDCQSGFCYSDFVPMGGGGRPNAPTCHAACIGPLAYELYCWDADDCCAGYCDQAGFCSG